jgi:hypothetical protein
LVEWLGAIAGAQPSKNRTSTFVNAMFFAFNLLQIAFRKAAILLSTVPVAILIFSLFIFLSASSRTGREGVAAGYGAMLYGTFLLFLLPLSIWWCIALMRVRVKSQFPEN